MGSDIPSSILREISASFFRTSHRFLTGTFSSLSPPPRYRRRSRPQVASEHSENAGPAGSRVLCSMCMHWYSDFAIVVESGGASFTTLRTAPTFVRRTPRPSESPAVFTPLLLSPRVYLPISAALSPDMTAEDLKHAGRVESSLRLALRACIVTASETRPVGRRRVM